MPESSNLGYQRPESVEAARDLVEELVVDRYYQDSDLQPLLAGLDQRQTQAVQEIARELRGNPFITEQILDFYGQKLWELVR